MLDILLIAFLSLRAYQDGTNLLSLNVCITDAVLANTLDRFEVPFFGRFASSFVDSE